MKKFLLLIIVVCCVCSGSSAQDAGQKKQPTLALNFVLNDFTTAQRLKNSSLAGVLQSKDWAQFNEMAYGLNLQYLTGLTQHVDFSGTLGASFLKYPFTNMAKPTSESLLLEADAAVNVKLLTDKYIVVPYVQAGIGVSSYRMTYFGAHIPLGLGLQINLGNQDAFFFTQANYKVAVTSSSSNHLSYSLGFAAPLKK